MSSCWERRPSQLAAWPGVRRLARHLVAKAKGRCERFASQEDAYTWLLLPRRLQRAVGVGVVERCELARVMSRRELSHVARFMRVMGRGGFGRGCFDWPEASRHQHRTAAREELGIGTGHNGEFSAVVCIFRSVVPVVHSQLTIHSSPLQPHAGSNFTWRLQQDGSTRCLGRRDE